MKEFAPVGNGRILAYMFGPGLEYVRGTNVVRAGAARHAAVGDAITTIADDPPPLAGATRAIVVDRITDLENREAVADLYARSVLVLALHQEVSGAFLAEPGDDVVIAHAMDVCGERGAAEAFFAWALAHRAVDGLLAWGLQKHLRFAYGSPLRDRLPAHLAATPPELPQATAGGLHEAVWRANRLGLLATESGLDLRGHALFLIAVHALVPPVDGGEDFFFVHQALAQEVRRKRALYGGAFHSGLVAAGGDPAAEVEVRADLKPAAIRIEPTDGGLYKVKVERTDAPTLWASDADPRPGGQEFARSSPEGPPDWVHDAVIYQLMVDRFARTDGRLPKPGSSTASELPTEVEFVDGPRAGERDRLAVTPPTIDAAGGVYRRSVRCADDGALRYVFEGAGETAAGGRPQAPDPSAA